MNSDMNVGYYIFLGQGDYHPSRYKTKEWVSAWTIKDWKQFIDDIKSLGSNTAMLYLNGHTLPYRSQCYPQLADMYHPNCKQEFLRELLHYGKEWKLIEVLVIPSGLRQPEDFRLTATGPLKAN